MSPSEPQPQPPDSSDPGLIGIEAALGALSPAPGRVDRDRVMFLAGRASLRPSPVARAAWPAVAAGLALVAIAEAAILANRAEPRVVERLVIVRETAPPEPAGPPDPAPAVASAPDPGGPSPVVILHRSPRADRPAIDPWPPLEAESGPARLRQRVLRFGIDALPEPPPLPVAMRPAGEVRIPTNRVLRAEIEQFLNPGESS